MRSRKKSCIARKVCNYMGQMFHYDYDWLRFGSIGINYIKPCDNRDLAARMVYAALFYWETKP